ncbi:MAG TPA: glycosyltransferase [Solirubrobacterales bacterium]|jgi:trehalose synthase
MAPLTHVPVAPLPPERFRELLGDRYEEVAEGIRRARHVFAGRAVWHVNSTARGGGVAELLQSLLAYARGAGVDARWVVIEGDPEFFRITKRIHNHLHGSPGDGGSLGEAERDVYEAALSANAADLSRAVAPADVVFLHDPQTAGLVPAMVEAEARVVWRCHVGLDLPNDLARGAWAFLRPYVEQAEAYVFSRQEFAWEGLDTDRIWVVPPSIDAFSPKNQDLEPPVVGAILHAAGLSSTPGSGAPTFLREDGTPGRVDRRADVDEDGQLTLDAKLVTQVSRWDRLKDPAGLVRSFAEHVPDHVHLLLAGPSVVAVADDPEGAEVLAEVREQRHALAPGVRERVHLAQLPMEDPEENAAIVNALQRRSDVVVQKSLAEGFGLTVAEAMWKARPVVASRLGGIRDQIVDGESGVLVDDPSDLRAVAAAIQGLLEDPDRAALLGEAARERIRGGFLGTRHLIQYLDLLDRLVNHPTDASRRA